MNKVHGGVVTGYQAQRQDAQPDSVVAHALIIDHDASHCTINGCERCQDFWNDELADRAISR